MERIFEGNEEQFYDKMTDIRAEAEEAYRDELPQKCFVLQPMVMMTLYFLTAVYSFTKRQDASLWKTKTLIVELSNIARTGEVFYLFPREQHGRAYALKKYMQRYPESVMDQLAFAGMMLEYYYRIYEKPIRTERYTRGVERALEGLLSIRKREEQDDAALKGSRKKFLMHIKHALDEEMVGQEEAKKAVAMAIYRFYFYDDRTPLMLEGPTGSGKTYLFELLANDKELQKKLTFFSYTATELTPNGFQGDNLQGMLKRYKEACKMQHKAIDFSGVSHKGIIFIDEMDKLLCYSNMDSHDEDVNQIVLHQMLTAVAGTSEIGEVDTKNILFIFAGAFENIEEKRREKKARHQAGFSAALRENVESRKDNSDEMYNLRQELIEMGASKQFVARIGTFVRMNRLGREEMKKILLDEEHGILVKKQEQFERDGLKLMIRDEAVIELMVDCIMENDMGARGATEMIASLVDKYSFDMIQKEYSTMILHEGVFNGEEPYFEREVFENEDDSRAYKRN